MGDSMSFKKVFFVRDNQSGDGEIGKRILKNLLLEIAKSSNEGECFVFVNEAANMSVRMEYIDLIEELQKANTRGVKIMTCKYSLEHLGLESALKVGTKASFALIGKTIHDAKEVVTL
jgi:hypothetical protein